jgi:predicted methyltransferase
MREYDQIPMRSPDLLRQVRYIAPQLGNKSVAFVGDSDGTSALLGLLSTLDLPCPADMLVLDFDERLLLALDEVARKHGFADRLTVQLYNVFDPLPSTLRGQYRWFYTNPPYGCRNDGESARLFVTRGCELASDRGGQGCVIAPYGSDPGRAWTRRSMLSIQRLLTEAGWVLAELRPQAHQYHLDDDRDLPSSALIVESVQVSPQSQTLSYAGRAVGLTEIADFYGRGVQPPYPRYIRAGGDLDFEWSAPARVA